VVKRAAGYTIIVCVMAVTVLSIAVAIALPLISGQIKREKEAELVFRGLQYAEAIRVFQRRFGRPPATLQELLDTRPRSIRRLWKDPMTESGEWVLLVNSPQGGRRRDATRPPGPEGEEGGEGGAEEIDPQSPEGRTQVPVGPIVGVRSRSDDQGMRTFFDSESYNSWRFTVDLLNIRPPGADGLPGIPRAAWIGKAFRKGLQSGTMPGGSPPNPPPRGGLGGDPGQGKPVPEL